MARRRCRSRSSTSPPRARACRRTQRGRGSRSSPAGSCGRSRRRCRRRPGPRRFGDPAVLDAHVGAERRAAGRVEHEAVGQGQRTHGRLLWCAKVRRFPRLIVDSLLRDRAADGSARDVIRTCPPLTVWCGNEAVAPGAVGNERAIVILSDGLGGVAQDASRTVFARSTPSSADHRRPGQASPSSPPTDSVARRSPTRRGSRAGPPRRAS